MLLSVILNFFFIIGSAFISLNRDFPSKGQNIGSLFIPSQNYFQRVVYSFEQDILDQDSVGLQAVGLKRNNFVLAGHNKKGVFSILEKLKVGEMVIFQIYEIEHRYRIEKRILVGEDDISLLEETKEEQLTLLTCIWDSSKRLVLIAKKESF